MHKSTSSKPHIVVILGPTASGKSALSVKLAKKLDGEIISADSRQVYKRLDIGTGKITRKEMQGVPHHLLDVADPRRQFTVIRFVKLAKKAISDIQKRGRLPIICGGTGFYIEALVDGMVMPDVPADKKLRARLSGMSAPKLLAMLKKLDPKRFTQISRNESDRGNPRRIIRAIEVAKSGGKTVNSKSQDVRHPGSPYSATFIGINPPRTDLRKKIHTRLVKRLNAGMLDEAKKLHKKGLSWKRMEEFGLEYRYMARFLQGKISKEEMIAKLDIEICNYAKRQMTWFRREPRIRWFSSKDHNLTKLVKRSIIV
jgi:tRNA dimethylallyltransferase